MNQKQDNLIEVFRKGLEGKTKGLPYGEGLEQLTMDTGGLKRGEIISLAGTPKSGKSTLLNYAFFVQPLLYAKENNIDLNILYYSFEIDKITMQFDIICMMLSKVYKMSEISIEMFNEKTGTTIDLGMGKITPQLLKGQRTNEEGHLIRVRGRSVNLVEECFKEHVEPIFKSIRFIEDKRTPEQIKEEVIKFCANRGHLIVDKNGEITSYTHRKENSLNLILVDHIRKFIRNGSIKDTIDEYSSNCVYLKNKLNCTFVNVIHINRDLGKTGSIKFFGDHIFATSENIKDSGNIAEDCTLMLTMFSPNDSRYNLRKHFGMVIKDGQNNPIYPNYRSIHLVESRFTPAPIHYRVNMMGGLKTFEKFVEEADEEEEKQTNIEIKNNDIEF